MLRWLCFIALITASSRVAAAADVDYLRDIKPIFTARCNACHGPLKHKNDLRLDTAAGARTGGSGGPAVVPGKSGDSLLIAAITGANGLQLMPPEGEPLTAEQISLLKAWIDQGAPSPADERPLDPLDHWSFKPAVRSALPSVMNTAWPKNAVDAFLAAEHERRGLTPSQATDKSTLLRRLHLDLIGLPPTRAEQQAFLADSAADA